MNIRLFRVIASRILLGFAYILLILQWLWLALFALPALIDSGFFESLSQPNSTQTPIIHAPTIELSPIVLWIVIAVTVALLATTVVVLIKLPKAILTTSEKVVERTVHAVMPVVTHHKQLPAKKRRAVSRRLRLIIQVSASLIAGIACLFLLPSETLTIQIIQTIGLGLMVLTIVGFVAAWLIQPARTTSRTRSPASRG